MKRILPALLLASCSSLALAAEGMNPSGTYTVEGTSPSGESYTGSVVIEKSGPGFALSYEGDPAGSYTGFGMVRGNVLSVAAAPGDGCRVAIAVLRAGEKFKVTYGEAGGSASGSEIWQKQ